MVSHEPIDGAGEFGPVESKLHHPDQRIDGRRVVGCRLGNLKEPAKIPPGLEVLSFLISWSGASITTPGRFQIEVLVGASDAESRREQSPIADAKIPTAGRKGELPKVRSVEIDEGDRTSLVRESIKLSASRDPSGDQ